MKEIVVISGKGGTGKTSLTASFAMLAENSILCDADVDAADLHLLTRPEIQETHDFLGGSIADIDRQICGECGLCRELCRFDAISSDYVVDRIACEGCGVCVDLCPEKAIAFPVQKCGEWFTSSTRFGPMVHARLGIAEENSGKLVSLIRQQARTLAEKNGLELIITDGPPGIGCPVIAAIGGATVVIIVVEPTVSGLHDMARVLDLAAHFRVPGMLCINKADINLEMTEKIEQLARKRNLTLLGRIPFDPAFTRAMIAAQNMIEYQKDGETAEILRGIWQKIIRSPSFSQAEIPDFSAAIR
jgi:MinD superfamily P-loop ATPase